MTTPIEDMQAAIAQLRADVDALKAESMARELERQRAKAWLRTMRDAPGDTTTDPKPREAGRE